MQSPPSGFVVLETFGTHGVLELSRARRLHDGRPVLLESPPANAGHPTPFAEARLLHEFHLLQFLDGDGAPRPVSLERAGNQLVVVLNVPTAVPLRIWLERERPDLRRLLDVAIGLARALAALHKHRIIHREVRPDHVLVEPDLSGVLLVGLGGATRLEREMPSAQVAEQFESSLVYVSPEQTGRMNRPVDFRSDFYSLGITLYELLTGAPPFSGQDTLELIHHHLARVPPPPHAARPEIPRVLSELVLRLLAKAAEDRYQSAESIVTHLEECRGALDQPDAPESLSPERPEGSGRFALPHHLYGREQDRARLLDAFQRVASGTNELLLVAGYAGIGKSSLIRELHRPVVERRGRFASGKSDQYRRHQPYVALVQALGEWISQVLAEPESRVASWRARLAAGLGPMAPVLATVVPDLALLLGPQPPIPELPPAESRNRLQVAFTRFFRLIAAPDSPLVLALDDLQWADSGTLALIEALATDAGLRHVLVIGAFRDHEVEASHPLSLRLRSIRDQGGTVHLLTLSPLDPPDVRQLVADALGRPVADVEGLASLCHDRTGGNPFFLGEFLRHLVTQGWIRFQSRDGRWEWDLDAVARAPSTDNVVELMLERIRRLPETTRQVLRLAACIGNLFDLETLSLVCDLTVPSAAGQLWSALSEGLITPLAAACQYLPLLATGDANPADPALHPSRLRYRFSHDRVQQACYSLLPESERPSAHLRIGRLLRRADDSRSGDGRAFEVLGHLNEGATLVTDPAERLEIARLNLEGSRRARDAAAFDLAFHCAASGRSCLPADAWQAHSELAFDLAVEGVTSALLSLRFDEMDRVAQEALPHAPSVADEARIHDVLIQSLMVRNRPIEAIRKAIPVLRRLGADFPDQPHKGHVILGLLATRWRLYRTSTQAILEQPRMSDPAALAAMRLLSGVFSSAYFALPALYPLIMFKFIELSLRHGNTGASAVGYAAYGVTLLGMFGDVEGGQRFGRLADDLIVRLGARESETKVRHIVEGFLYVWRKPHADVLPPYLACYESYLETGDLEFGAYAAMMYGYFHFFAGTNLHRLAEEQSVLTREIERLQQATALHLQRIFQQLVVSLVSDSPQPGVLRGGHYDIDAQLPVHRKANDGVALVFACVAQMILASIFRAPARVLEFAEHAAPFVRAGAGLGTTVIPLYHLLDTVASAATAAQSPGPAARRWLRRARRHLPVLRRWAARAPLHTAHLVPMAEAWVARAEGRSTAALALLASAAEQATTTRHLLEAALCHEWRGTWTATTDVADDHALRQALLLYQQWGATAKVRDLTRSHPDLATAPDPDDPRTTSALEASLPRPDARAPGLGIDFMAVARSARVIAAELALEPLLRNVLRAMLEAAGAQRGALLAERDGHLVVEVESDATTADAPDRPGLPLPETPSADAGFPISVLNYVARSRREVLLADATVPGVFSADPYIAQRTPRSLFCLPALHRGELAAIVYLENNLVTHAFPQERVTVLEVLASQAAISIAHARIYRNLEALNQSYARFVPHEFLRLIGKNSIVDVRLGDNVERTMSILFSDIRAFTSLSEDLTPEETFGFINSFHQRMEPVVQRHHGFIDKYVGDAIMALFPGRPDDAIDAAVDMLRALEEFNADRASRRQSPVRIGIGVNTGRMMLGTIGGTNRMEGTVISDAVNVAARLQNLTKTYATPLLVSAETLRQLENPQAHRTRRLDRVQFKGRRAASDIYEVFDADPEELAQAKTRTRETLHLAVDAFHEGHTSGAIDLLDQCRRDAPSDVVLSMLGARWKTLQLSERPSAG